MDHEVFDVADAPEALLLNTESSGDESDAAVVYELASKRTQNSPLAQTAHASRLSNSRESAGPRSTLSRNESSSSVVDDDAAIAAHEVLSREEGRSGRNFKLIARLSTERVDRDASDAESAEGERAKLALKNMNFVGALNKGASVTTLEGGSTRVAFTVDSGDDTESDSEPSYAGDPDAGDSSSESEAEEELLNSTGGSGFKKSVSIRATFSQAKLKEGFLLKYAGRFHGWKKRWCYLAGSKLYYSKHADSVLQVEVAVASSSVAEESDRNADNGFEVNAPATKVKLRCESRPEMEQWMAAFRTASASEETVTLENTHHWYLKTNKGRQCNVCGHGLSKQKRSVACAVCRVRVCKKCASAAHSACKWTTLASFSNLAPGSNIPHQWTQGNLRHGSKCAVCSKKCGAGKKLADFRCLWCHGTVHGVCKLMYQARCSFGRHKVSILPPSCIILTKTVTPMVRLNRSLTITPLSRARLLGAELDHGAPSPLRGSPKSPRRPGSPAGRRKFDVGWAVIPAPNTSPLIVFVNTKSGGHDGVKMMRLMKGLLNPAQVFDLAKKGPAPGLELMMGSPDGFRAVGCGGDGTIGWILQEASKLGITGLKLGILPLGTGNDLSRVLGWGPSFNDELDGVSDFIDAIEKSKVQHFDRWGIAVKSNEAPDQAAPSEPQVSPIPDGVVLDTLSPLGEIGEEPGAEGDVEPPPFSPVREYSESGQLTLSALEDQPDPEDPDDHLYVEVAAYTKPNPSTDTADDVAMHKQYSLVKRLGRFLKVFLNSMMQMFAGKDSGADEVTSDDLAGMVEDYVAAMRVLTAPGAARTAGSGDAAAAAAVGGDPADELDALCDELEIQTNLFIGMLFSDDGSDEETYTSLTELRAVVTATIATAVACTDAGKSQNEPPSARAPMGRRESLKIAESPAFQQVPGVPKKRISLRLRGRQAGPVAASGPKPADLRTDVIGDDIASMNNYFGIGLDAKVAMDFDQFRNNNPEKCRSRMKNQMWYGMLGTKEMIHQTCKNLHQRLVLECDGEVINLPKLQGIVILNIHSYMGGTNFWGSKVEKRFLPQAFDDGILEVVSVKSTAQMAAIKSLPGISPMRLAQARSIRITVKSGEPVPIQVDGEAWMQNAGCSITIYNKGQVQMLSRDKALQRLLTTWARDKEADGGLDDDVDEKLISEVEVSTCDLIISARALGVEFKSIATVFERACSAVEHASKKLHKGKVKQTRVLEYLTAVGVLIEEVGTSLGESDTDGAVLVSSRVKVIIPVASLADSGADVKLHLAKCQMDFANAVELCNNRALSKFHSEVNGRVSFSSNASGASSCAEDDEDTDTVGLLPGDNTGEGGGGGRTVKIDGLEDAVKGRAPPRENTSVEA